ncbi:MAG: ATP-binding protein [Chlamydiae bacterium]|nr:ATP-binding protein [Chlamydiota bacterium]MBI3276753.1 ATP-binding protein [Chlamydiota bacterium]
MEEINLSKYNRHWEKDFRYPYSKERKLLPSLIQALIQKEIIELIGLRRTGKTILALQLINYLLEKKIPPLSIWYFTFDEDQPSLDDLIQSFSKQIGINYKKEKIYLFLDEIQKLTHFQNQLKIYYDLYPNLKFFITGSTSLFIKKKTQESLAGRILTYHLSPLDFEEYLHFKERADLLKKPSAFFTEIEIEFELFLKSQFIDAVSLKIPADRKNYFVGVIRKIIYEDIPMLFPVENPEILWRLVRIIAQNPGLLVHYQKMSQELGISDKTISSYLHYLEESFLIRKIFNFSRNQITSEKRLKKFYLASPSFAWALTDFSETGRLVENLVISLKDYHFFWRDPYQHEVDFIELLGDQSIMPIEVKYQKEIRTDDLKNLVLFSKKFKLPQAYILGRTLEEKILLDDQGIQIIEKPIYFI